jgi:pilus assembly protein TadC
MSSKKISIPLSPFPLPMLQRFSEPFQGIGSSLARTFSGIELELEQADIALKPEQYLAIGVFTAVFHFLFWTIVVGLFMVRLAPDLMFTMPPAVGFIFATLVFIQIIAYPKILVKKKVRDVEQNLIFGLRTITIQIRSGVSLFASLSLVAYGNYGTLSSELKRAVDEINAGIPEEDALQRAAIRTPSVFFRRSLWQIVNGLKAGADISLVLTELVRTMTKEQIIQIKKYGADLRLLSLVYMMLGVIVPALGLTLLVILSTFPDSPVTETMLWGFLGFIVLSQVMYIGIIKSKRPSLMAGE